MKRTGLTLNVGEILDGRAPEKTIDFSETLDREDLDIRLSGPVAGAVRFIPADGGLVGLFHVQAPVQLLCSKDGEPYRETLELRFTHEFRSQPQGDESPILPDHTVDISPLLWDEVVVNIPMKPLCPPHKE